MASLAWEQAGPFGIAFLDDKQQTFWNAGHVNDVLAVGYTAVAASDSGGVWLINPDYDAIPQTNEFPAQCLSDDWSDVNMNALAFGPDGQTQDYAGCWDAPNLYALTFKAVLGGLDFVQAIPLNVPWWIGGIAKIVVQSNPRRIVVATGYGVFWSPIPTPFDLPSGYTWTLASGITFGEAYSGLALGPNGTIVAAAYGANLSTKHYGLFTGAWNKKATTLTFTRATISGVDPLLMLRTSVASCAGDRTVLYAVSAAADESMYTVLKSQDGGANWSPTTMPANAGNQGSYNNSIDVMPSDSSRVAIGWRGGPFLSTTGGSSWVGISAEGLHSDLHVVYFPAPNDDPGALFVGSDGGLVLLSNSSSQDPTAYTSETRYNMHLRNLQIYGGNDTASAQVAGLYAAGTQDNGNLYLVVDPSAPPINQPWLQTDPGDGGLNRLIATGQLIRRNNTLVISNVEVGNRERAAAWNQKAETFPDGIGTLIPVDGTTGGLPYPVIETVVTPTYQQNNQLMYAVAGKGDNDQGTQGVIYGLFADPDGGNIHWTRVGQAPDAITCIASVDGTQIFLGTKKNAIYVCDPKTSALTPMPLSAAVDSLGGSFAQLIALASGDLYGLHSGYGLVAYHGSAWDVVPTLPVSGIGALAVDRATAPATLYVATSTAVFASTDNGFSWANESQGLPTRPQLDDLQIALTPNGDKYLYAGTYGRSLWRAQIPGLNAPVNILPNIVAVLRILFGVINDGGGWTTGGPEPPWGPERDLLAGAVAVALAQGLPEGVSAPRANVAARFIAQRAGELQGGQIIGGTAQARSLVAGAPRGASLRSRLRMLFIIWRSLRQATDAHLVVMGALAASLSRRRSGGAAARREALRFTQERADAIVAATLPARQRLR